MGESIECEKFRPNCHGQTGRGEWQMIGPGHRGTGALCHAKMLIIPGKPILRVPNLAPHFCSGIHLAAGDVVLGRPKQMRLVYSMFFPAIVLTSLKPFVLY